MSRLTIALALAILLTASAVSAQTQGNPQPAKPNAPAQGQLFSPTPFPEGARVGFIDFQLIAQESATGKAATLRLKALQSLKFTEIDAKNKALAALQSQQAQAANTAATAAKLQKDIERAQLDVQYSRQLAQKEIDDLTEELTTDLSDKVKPVVAQLLQEKGLWAVFIANENLIGILPGVDLSMEVVKRLDTKKQDK